MHVEEDDVFGGPVNLATHVVGPIKGMEIWLSHQQKKTLIGSVPQNPNDWNGCHYDVAIKGCPGAFTLWSVL
jgi:class 3 adenylate cyclase